MWRQTWLHFMFSERGERKALARIHGRILARTDARTHAFLACSNSSGCAGAQQSPGKGVRPFVRACARACGRASGRTSGRASVWASGRAAGPASAWAGRGRRAGGSASGRAAGRAAGRPGGRTVKRTGRVIVQSPNNHPAKVWKYCVLAGVRGRDLG